MLPALLDTDILSAIIRRDSLVVSKAQAYLSTYRKFTFSIITRYEILRGLKAKDAAKQLDAFERFCNVNDVITLSDEIAVKASDVYAFLKKRGELVGDADILIASTALVNGLLVVTNNTNHFRRMPNLLIQNWLQDEPI
ncbi:type II toxin-antitoxin system VapC family toxin [Nodosilinea sp. PGN35]|uniref:type II toxin-antitoxin system VapC family toxin n=1 Tax=Nodosilinea sp. PGN35 TaxID=3020489 RepID=UPI0023B34729|nr:type II toxin-antitoxin system VapC family toxin [Nodosilinea sp. TSF1-S3]MDF0368079.1 type II toxin-antitoxin system VapC family toxin [Nodosilinea sp. TSF1-S3]